MRNRKMLALLAASGLAACSSNASSSLPGLDARPAAQSNAAAAPPSAGDFTAVSAFKMRDNAGGRIVAMYPTLATWSSLGAAKPDGTPDDNLAYNGGAVQVRPALYLVFWGPQWTTPGGDPSGVRPLLSRFLRAAGAGRWNATVSQYYQIANGRRQSAGGSAGLPAGSWIDPGGLPSGVVSAAQVRAEADRAAQHFGDFSAGAGYLIALPHGVTTPGFGSMFCAYHDFTGSVSFTSLPYVPDAGSSCGAGAVNAPGTADGVTIVASHELAEIETDPQPLGGWYGPLGEIADPCAWRGLANNPEAGGYPTQPLWSNAAGACVQSSR